MGDEICDALRESEERYRTLFEQAPVGVFLFDRDLRVTECNPRLVTILASSYEKIVGFDLHRLRDQSPRPALDRVLEGEPSSYEGAYEATTSNARVTVSMRLCPLRDSLGEVVGGLCVVEDITEREAREDALVRAEARFAYLMANLDLVAGQTIPVLQTELRTLEEKGVPEAGRVLDRVAEIVEMIDLAREGGEGVRSIVRGRIPGG